MLLLSLILAVAFLAVAGACAWRRDFVQAIFWVVFGYWFTSVVAALVTRTV